MDTRDAARMWCAEAKECIDVMLDTMGRCSPYVVC